MKISLLDDKAREEMSFSLVVSTYKFTAIETTMQKLFFDDDDT